VANCIPLPSTLNERTLLRELNHRINNEFASAINLVSAGAVLAENPEVKVALSGVAELLHKYADVHRALMVPVGGVLIDAAKYLRRLGLAMSRSILDRLNVHLLIAADTLPLESDRCWQLGLIIHELVTNAARHACFENGNGEIRVELKRSGAVVNCSVFDNGSVTATWKPGHGLRIVSDLAKILGGHIEHARSDSDIGERSRSVLLAFPLTERERRDNGSVAWRRRSNAPRFKSRHASSQAPAAGRLPARTEVAPSKLRGTDSGFVHSHPVGVS
jgi:two-component sensor histidine kinase